MTTLSMQGISKSFFGVEVLHCVDFAVDRGEIERHKMN
jgi:ABC-type sugar transport system ATPase subunit